MMQDDEKQLAQQLIEQNKQLLAKLNLKPEREFDIGAMITEAGLPEDDLQVRALYTRDFESAREAREAVVETVLNIAHNNPTDADQPSHVAKPPQRVDKQTAMNDTVRQSMDAILRQPNISHPRKLEMIARMKANAIRDGWEGS